MGLLSLVLSDPLALPALVQVKLYDRAARRLPTDPNLRFCYEMLNNVSRSFAIVIQQLGPELRDAVCIFYLVLRALDTVEDDMSIDKGVKVPQLLAFYKKIDDPKFSMECGTGHYRLLMKEYPKVTAAFLKLSKEHKHTITDITKRMGAGMAEFIQKEVVTLDDYNLYCHYVAGLVGIGLSNLFVASRLEDPRFAKMDDLSNKMGLFLQKTNIIRDYLEDIVEEPAPRMFWPRVVWSKHAKKLEDFQEPKNSAAAVRCLNELITNALEHATESLQYMAALQEPRVFRFCAIPQVMAIATLAECYANPEVFKRVVKIPKTTSARIMVGTGSIRDVALAFRVYARKLALKVDPADPNATATREVAQRVDRACLELLLKHPAPTSATMQLLLVLLVLLLAYLLHGYIRA